MLFDLDHWIVERHPHELAVTGEPQLEFILRGRYGAGSATNHSDRLIAEQTAERQEGELRDLKAILRYD